MIPSFNEDLIDLSDSVYSGIQAVFILLDGWAPKKIKPDAGRSNIVSLASNKKKPDLG